jgi:hypothetical protein
LGQSGVVGQFNSTVKLTLMANAGETIIKIAYPSKVVSSQERYIHNRLGQRSVDMAWGENGKEATCMEKKATK